jgi:hypothetical protein
MWSWFFGCGRNRSRWRRLNHRRQLCLIRKHAKSPPARRKINLDYLLGFLLYRIWPIFLSQRKDQQIGKNLVYRLIQRRSELKPRFPRRYNYERAKYEDQKIIQEYFDSVHKDISQYGISPEDIYSFDETGVITGSDRYSRPSRMGHSN